MQQILEYLDLRPQQISQPPFDQRIKRWKLRSSPKTKSPYPGRSQKPSCPVHAARTEPESELPRATREPRTSWGDFDLIGFAAREDRFVDNDPVNSNEIRNAIQVSLWICSKIIIENDENILFAKVRLPISNVQRVAAGRHHLIMSDESLLERQLSAAIVAHQSIVRVQSFYRITQRTDNFTLWNMRTNPLSRLRVLEISGADLADHRLSRTMQEMACVPREPLLIVPREEMSLFHIERQTDVPTRYRIQPCGRGPWGPDHDEIGHSRHGGLGLDTATECPVQAHERVHARKARL